jgi:hypothetical protein
MANKPAPGQTGPKGLAPRTTYSRSNTGSPPPPDAGSASQKGMQPRGMEFLPSKTAEVLMDTDRIMTRPLLQDLVKEAMAGTISKAEISAEAERQLIPHGEGEEKTASVTAPDHIPTEYVEKLADACGFLADQFEKGAEGEGLKPGVGPNATEVLEATSSETNIDAGQMGSATGGNQPPKTPGTQGEKVQSGKANTGLETNDEMSHGEQPTEPIKNEKAGIGPSSGDKTVTAQALFEHNLERLAKLGQDPEAILIAEAEKIARANPDMSSEDVIKEAYKGMRQVLKAPRPGVKTIQGPKPVHKPPRPSGKTTTASADVLSMIRGASTKLAEDAINPAQISGKGAAPPEASAAEQAVPAQPSDHNAQTSKMVSSNEKAIDYTKRDAKADPKSDMGDVLDEPAQTSSTDKTLAKTLDHTNEAGAKISSAQGIAEDLQKTAAARVLLSKLAEQVNGDKKSEKNKKEKESMLGAGAATPTVSQPAFSG